MFNSCKARNEEKCNGISHLYRFNNDNDNKRRQFKICIQDNHLNLIKTPCLINNKE